MFLREHYTSYETNRVMQQTRLWGSSFRKLCIAILAWVFVWPLTRVVRRHSSIILFYGRDGGKFIDNCKYLYAHITEQSTEKLSAIYLANNVSLREELLRLGGRAEIARSLRGFWLWLRAGTIVVDSVDWIYGYGFAGSRGARIVQLWHGIPLKAIQLGRVGIRDRNRSVLERLLFRGYIWTVGRLAYLDWLISTSKFVTETAFSGSFRYRKVANSGYPRNDVIVNDPSPLQKVGVDEKVEAAIKLARQKHNLKVGLYAPTFRESLDDPFVSAQVDLRELSRIAEDAGIFILIKLHPWMHDRIRSKNMPGVIFVKPDSDIYPVLKMTDFLITDYSSIFFDYLLSDKPIIFYCYDISEYLLNERQMYYDYYDMSPGPKCKTLAEVRGEVFNLTTGKDRYQGARERVRSKVFDNVDGRAANRIIEQVLLESKQKEGRD